MTGIITYGWFCRINNGEFIEDEGIVYFDGHPSIGQEFTVPSDGSRARVTSVRDHDFSFTAKPIKTP